MRKRKIIRRGEYSYAITLFKTDMDDFGLIEGEEVDIDDLLLLWQKKSGRKKSGRKGK